MRRALCVLAALTCAVGVFAGGQKEAQPASITFSVMASGTYDKAAASIKDAFQSSQHASSALSRAAIQASYSGP